MEWSGVEGCDVVYILGGREGERAEDIWDWAGVKVENRNENREEEESFKGSDR